MTATRQRVWLALGLVAIPAAAFVPGGTVNAPHVQTRPAVSSKPDGLKFSSPAGLQPFPEAQTPMKKGLSDGYWGLVYPRSKAAKIVEDWMDYARNEMEPLEFLGEQWLEWNATFAYLEQLDFDIEQGTPDFVFALSSGSTDDDRPAIRALATVILSDFQTIAPAPGVQGVMIRKIAVKPSIEEGEEHESLEAEIIRQICEWSQDIDRFVAIELIDRGLREHYRQLGFRKARYSSFMIHEGADSEVLAMEKVRKLNFLIISEPFHDNQLLSPLQDLGIIGKPPADYPVSEKRLKLPWQVQGLAHTLDLLMSIGGNNRSGR